MAIFTKKYLADINEEIQNWLLKFASCNPKLSSVTSDLDLWDMNQRFFIKFVGYSDNRIDRNFSERNWKGYCGPIDVVLEVNCNIEEYKKIDWKAIAYLTKTPSILTDGDIKTAETFEKEALAEFHSLCDSNKAKICTCPIMTFMNVGCKCGCLKGASID